MNIDIIARMRAVQEVAAFSVTDMARWFGVKRMTMSAWLLGYANPLPPTKSQLEYPLSLLERVSTTKKFADRVPVPLTVGLYGRKDFIEKLKADAIIAFPKNNTAGRGNAVQSINQQKQEGDATVL